MKVIFDAASLIYASCFKSKEDRESSDDLFETDVIVALSKFNDKFIDLLSRLREKAVVDDVIVCNGSKYNFRTEVSKDYKANRTQNKPSILSDLHEIIKMDYGSTYGIGVETDDVVATLWKDEVDKNGINSVLIMSLDKDYKQFPCWFYDYHPKRNSLTKISEEEANKNFYSQMIVGDSADNINYCKGYGSSYANKIFKDKSSEYSMFSSTYRLYKQIWGEEAKDKFNEARTLLKLKTDCHENIKG